MSYRRPPRPVENYTSAFLVSTGVILFMAFFTIAAAAGFLWVLLTAAGIEATLRLVARLRAGRRQH